MLHFLSGGADEGIGGSPDTVALIAAHAQNLGLSKAQCTDLLKVSSAPTQGMCVGSCILQ